MVTRSSVFPDLGRSGLERISLMGFIEGPGLAIKKFWSVKPTSMSLRIEGVYFAGKKEYLRQLHISFSPKHPARVVIEIRKHEGRPIRSALELTDENFLAFCKYVFDDSSLKVWPFMMKTFHRFPYRPSLLLPFSPVPQGDQYVVGVKFGFSKNRSLHRLMIEKEDDHILVSLTSKPIFRLHPERFNSLFFESVIRHANGAVAPLFGKREVKHAT